MDARTDGNSSEPRPVAELLRAVLSHESLNATSGIDQSLLTGVERVGVSRNFDIDHAVLHPVDHLGVVRLGGGNADPLVLAVNKQHRIVIGMNTCLHDNSREEPL